MLFSGSKLDLSSVCLLGIQVKCGGRACCCKEAAGEMCVPAVRLLWLTLRWQPDGWLLWFTLQPAFACPSTSKQARVEALLRDWSEQHAEASALHSLNESCFLFLFHVRGPCSPWGLAGL